MYNRGVLYWITGLSGAGKTTLGNRLYYEKRKEQDNVILLGGDILKNIVGDSIGYTIEDRKKRAIKYAMLCKTLTDQGIIVICCTIAMFDEVREWNRKNNKGYVEIFLDVPREVLEERDQKGMYSSLKKGKLTNLPGIDMEVEFPKNPDIIIKNDGRYSVKECVDKILAYDVSFSSDFDRDSEYWNRYYEGNPNIEMPSPFAQYISSQISRGNLLELGCGNGRDSLFFEKLGLNVTAIDASRSAIKKLQEENERDNICFICDDFVCSPTIFAGQYDYCYSRFSIHAINEEQEKEVITNVHKVLKSGGKFFIEVRSVHDEIYGKGKKVGKNSFIYGGHFRRFIEKEELENELIKKGFFIEYSEENRGFAPFENEDPLVIRIIARK